MERHESRPTIPTTLAEERLFNLFLRAQDLPLASNIKSIVQANPAISVAAGQDRTNPLTRDVKMIDEHDEVQVIRALRALKDSGIPKPPAKV
jgi:hypothetical protein